MNTKTSSAVSNEEGLETEQTDSKKDIGYSYNQEIKDKKVSVAMSDLLQKSQTPPSISDVVEGVVIGSGTGGVYVDLSPFGTGIIYGRELMNARDIIKRVNVGDTISGKIVDTSNEWGYIEISLKEARQAVVWEEAEKAVKLGTIFDLTVEEANKGGLLMTWQGVQGFLPASQLSTKNYPKVEDSDKDKILDELRKLTGEKLSVSIITALPKEEKLIFSEKIQGQTENDDKEKQVEKYSVGEVVEGEVTGIVDFGIFIKIEEGLEGLVHISEIDWGLVDDPKQMFKVGEKIEVKIIEVKNDKISLSIKALKENPWKEAAKKYKEGQEVEGVIIKFNKHGALASIEEGVAGLVHVSEFGNEDQLRETLELGKNYKFTITLFDPVEQKMTLTYKKI